MRRSRDSGGNRTVRFLIGLTLSIGALFAGFSLLPEHVFHLSPFDRVKAEEVHFYQDLFDLTSQGQLIGEGPTMRLEGFAMEGRPAFADTSLTPRWMFALLHTNDRSDTVRVRRLRSLEGGLLIKTSREHPIDRQRQFVLIPADRSSIQRKYAEVIARELGLICPEVSFCRVEINGVAKGVFLREERVSEELLEKNRLADAVLFEKNFDALRPDHLMPRGIGDSLAVDVIRDAIARGIDDLKNRRWEEAEARFDAQAMAAMACMLAIEDRFDLLLEEGHYVFKWTDGRILPIHRSLRSPYEHRVQVEQRLAWDLLGTWLQHPPFRARCERMMLDLQEKTYLLRERFDAMDKAWGPLLAGSTSRVNQPVGQADLIANMTRARLDKHFDLHTRPPAGHDLLIPYLIPEDRDLIGADDQMRTLAERTGGIVRGDTLFLWRRRIHLEEDLILPPGKALSIEHGVHLELDSAVSVLVQGPLFIRGNRSFPVYIRANDPAKPYGTIAVSGNGSQRCDLRWVYISDGREAVVGGHKHTGMLSIHNSDVRMERSWILESRGEDGLNIKDGNVDLRNVIFSNAHADLADLDRVQGSLENCTFGARAEDANGDGLDVSFSKVTIKGCTFQNLADKGLSIGEVSEVLVLDCKFLDNQLAMAVKDLSVAHVSGNLFRSNALVFDLYRKKPIYGGGRLILYANEFIDNQQDRRLDGVSMVEVRNTVDADVWQRFGQATEVW